MKNKFEQYKGILSVAIPTVISYLFLYLENTLDMKMVSTIRPEAMVAVYVTLNPNFFLQCLPSAIATIMVMLIPKYIAAEEKDKANRVMLTGVILTAVYGLIIGLVSYLNADLFMDLCNAEESIHDDAVIYFRTLSAMFVVPAVSVVTCGVMQGVRKSKVIIYCSAAGGVVNLCLDYLLIGGKFGFPRLGVLGAAIATNVSRVVYFLIPFVYLLIPKTEVNFIYCIKRKIMLTKACLMKFVDNGFSIWCENLANRIGLVFLARIASEIGSDQFVVYTVGVGVLSFTLALAMGLQTGVIAELSKVMGSNDEEEIRQTRKTVLRLSGILCVIIVAIIILLAYPYLRFFFDDITLIKIGMLSAIFLLLISPAQVMQIVYSGILKVYGETRYSMYAGIIGVLIINPLVALILVRFVGIGLWGVWIAGLLAQLVRAAMLMIKAAKKTGS